MVKGFLAEPSRQRRTVSASALRRPAWKGRERQGRRISQRACGTFDATAFVSTAATVLATKLQYHDTSMEVR